MGVVNNMKLTFVRMVDSSKGCKARGDTGIGGCENAPNSQD